MLRIKIKPDKMESDKAKEKLAASKARWIKAKKQIDLYTQNKQDKINKWSSITSYYELSRHLKPVVQKLENIPPKISNAFLKGIEIFSLLKTHKRMFDNASLPGDFIRAAEYIWPGIEWRANSLVGGLDDRFNLIKTYPERWMMNDQMNGDVTVKANLDIIAQRLDDEKFIVDLYTSDLGFMVKNYYLEEEEHFDAHQGQVELGLRILAPGGTFIVKTFTMFNKETHRLLSETASKFKQFYVIKPETSKPDNSECYWLGINKLDQFDEMDECIYLADAVKAADILSQIQSKKIVSNLSDMLKKKRHVYDTDAWIKSHLA